MNQTFAKYLVMKTTQFNIKYVLFLAAVLSVLLVLSSFLLPVVAIGDVGFYYAYIKGLAEHASPAIQPESLSLSISLFGVDISKSDLLLHSVSGNSYGAHFFFYSLLCVPAYNFLHLLNIDPVRSFQLTNAFFDVILIWYILFLRSTPEKFNYLIAAVFLLSTGSIYFQWCGPELLTAMLLVVASVEFCLGRYSTCALFAAFASLQNPSAIFMSVPAVLLIGKDFASNFLEKSFCKKFFKDLMVLLVSFVILLLPYVWSYVNFKTFNPIVKLGYIDYSLISFERLWALYFDISQGVIVGVPFLMFVLPCVLIGRFIQSPTGFCLKEIDFLIVSSLLMSIPVLAQTNWNAGGVVFMRYASWVAMPLVVWAVHSLTFEAVPYNKYILTLGLAVQVFVAFSIGGFSLDRLGSYLSFRSYVNSIWHYNPHLYNPIPQVFSKRITKVDTGGWGPFPPVVYSEGNQYIKILTKSFSLHAVAKEVCHGRGDLVAVDDRATSRPVFVSSENGFYYLNGRMKCSNDVRLKTN